jgi:hypothetical protein
LNREAAPEWMGSARGAGSLERDKVVTAIECIVVMSPRGKELCGCCGCVWCVVCICVCVCVCVCARAELLR